MRLIIDHDYSGNVRELENVVERAVTLCNGLEAGTECLPEHLLSSETTGGLAQAAGTAASGVPDGGMDLEKTIEDMERVIIMDALKKSGGVKKKAAELLGLSFRSMRYKLSKYGIPDI